MNNTINNNILLLFIVFLSKLYIMKMLDVLKKYNFTDDVQNNIKILLKKFGSKFNIKYKKHILPVEIYKDTNLKCFIL